MGLCESNLQLGIYMFNIVICAGCFVAACEISCAELRIITLYFVQAAVSLPEHKAYMQDTKSSAAAAERTRRSKIFYCSPAQLDQVRELVCVAKPQLICDTLLRCSQCVADMWLLPWSPLGVPIPDTAPLPSWSRWVPGF